MTPLPQLPPVPPPSKTYYEKHKSFILALFSIIMVVIILIILFVPFIPIQYTVTKTRTVNLQYSSEEWGNNIMGNFIPTSVNVTNKDTMGGAFSVTMKYWENNPLSGQSTLLDSSTQSAFISSGATYGFPVPSSWDVMTYMNAFSLTYSVSAPTKQENYNLTNTEYKSIIDLISGA
jgi:hypothetical protein